MASFIEQIQELNKKYNKVLTVTELKAICQKENLEQPKAGAIDEYAFVHVTDYPPNNNIQPTPRNEAIIKKEENESTVSGRDSVHFSVNGRVRGHGSGDWDKKKYAIIIPGRDFTDKYKDEIYSVAPQDTFIRGNANLEGAILLCPESEYEDMQKQNPGTCVIPVEGDYAINVKDGNNIDNVSDLLSAMNIHNRIPGQSGWITHNNLPDTKAENEYMQTMAQTIGRTPVPKHIDSILRAEETILGFLGRNDIKGFTQFLIDCKEITEGFTGNDEQQLTQQQIKNSSGRLNAILLKYGLSDLQFYEPHGYSEITKREAHQSRMEQSQEIDQYLGINISDLGQPNIFKANIERIKLLTQKMQAEGTNHSPKSMQMLKNVLTHVINDFVTLNQCHDKRLDLQDLDMNKFAQELRSDFSELGIHTDKFAEYLDSPDNFEIDKATKSIQKQIVDEVEIKQFLTSNGYTEEPTSDFALRDANRIISIEEIMAKEAMHNQGVITDDTLSYYDQVANDFSKEKANTSSIAEIETKLQQIGISSNNFSTPGKNTTFIDGRASKITNSLNFDENLSIATEKAVETPNLTQGETAPQSLDGKNKIKAQLLQTLNEPPTLEKREEARGQLEPQQEQEIIKNDNERE